MTKTSGRLGPCFTSLSFLALVIGSVLMAGCGGKKPPAAPAGAPPTAVEVVAVVSGTVTETLQALGTVEPRKNHLLLLEAMKLVQKNTNVAVELVIAGGVFTFFGFVWQSLENEPLV